MLPFMADTELVNVLVIHLLVSFRFLALLLTSSAFMLPGIPNTLRFWLSLALTVIVLPSVNVDVPLLLTANWPYLLLVAGREFMLGAMLGFISSLPLYAMQFSGFMDSTFMGFTMMNMMDPTSSSQVSVLAQMKHLLAIWFFLHWNGHLLLVQALTESVRLIPPGIAMWTSPDHIPWIDWLQRAMVIALKLSLPMLGAILLAEIGLGFVARTVPQMNVFVLGIPLKIAVGLLVLLMILPSGVDVFHGEIERAVTWALEGMHFWR